MFNNNTLHSVQLKDGKLHVIHRQLSGQVLLSYPAQPAPDKVWKEIYGVKNGEIVLEDTIDGVHRPERTVPESIEFPSQENQ